jgi:hypothetical protein
VTLFDGSVLVSACPQVPYRTNHLEVSCQLHVPAALLQGEVSPSIPQAALSLFPLSYPEILYLGHLQNCATCFHYFTFAQSYVRNPTAAFNPLTPNDPYMGRTAPLTSRRCILYIYSTNIRTEYFKHAAHSPFFFSSKCRLFHNATFFWFPYYSHFKYRVC